VNISIRCAWCQSEMGEERFETTDERLPYISHGICPACQLRVFGNIENSAGKSAKSKEN